jgi:hypothetical protein
MTEPAEPAPPTVADLAERARKAKLSPQSVFSQHPAIGEQTLCDGTRCAVPYHSYHSDATIIWGAADMEWVKGALKGPYKPLLGKDGRAQVALWAVEYQDTMLNPYKEYIIVFAVVPNGRGTAPTVAFPHQQLQLFEDKQAFPYIYKLWLDKQLPTTYGRQLLGCDKYFDPAMKVAYGRRTLSMEAHHVAGEVNSAAAAAAGPLVRGTIKFAEAGHLGPRSSSQHYHHTPPPSPTHHPYAQAGHLRSLISAFGLCRTLGIASGVRGSWHVVNPPGIMERPDSALYNPVPPTRPNPQTLPLPRAQPAGQEITRSHLASRCQVWTFHFETSPKFTRAPKAKGIALEYGGELKAMGFEALLYQHDPKLRAVLLPPWTYTAVTGSSC